MSEINTMNTQQPATTPTPEASGDQGGARTFTQDEVNRIVSERLARERAKTELSPADEREQAIKAREAKMDCREYISEAGFPAALLDILDTSDFETFKATVEKLDGIVTIPSTKRNIPYFSGPVGPGAPPSGQDRSLRSAFGLK